MTDQYAVIGNPVAHSKSPEIHASFASQCGQDMAYSRILAEVDTFEQTVRDFFKQGGQGLNVTVPFKQLAYEMAQSLSPQATLAGAVNTLLIDDNGGLYGHNTDGIGLVCDITENLNEELNGRSVLILGAGGATRGILQPILEQRPATVLVANRTASKAIELGAVFSRVGPVSGCGLDDIPDQSFDWIINATAASLQGDLPDVSRGIISNRSCCYDLMYSSEATPFCRWALENGAGMASDGLGMLVEQAAESFWFWRGVRPDSGPVIAALRAALSV